jgi:hypothetical protein
MEKIPIEYRTWYQGLPPRPIKLPIPGWAGDKNEHTYGDKPQPWHCVPFVEGSTYGLELIYNCEGTCYAQLVNGKVEFDGDFSEDRKRIETTQMPPFSTFAPGHFGMSSCLDIKVPEGYVLRTEPHPRFYTDETDTVPCCLPGHLSTHWWPKIFFVVFKNPRPGQTLIFRKGEPFAQILILPQKVQYDIKEMSPEEAVRRNFRDENIGKFASKIITNKWKDYLGNEFDDKYKVLNNVFIRRGMTGINEYLEQLGAEAIAPRPMKFKTKLIKRKPNEGVQDKEKK